MCLCPDSTDVPTQWRIQGGGGGSVVSGPPPLRPDDE